MRNLILSFFVLVLAIAACNSDDSGDRYMLGEWHATVEVTSSTCLDLDPFEAWLMVYKDHDGTMAVDELVWDETELITNITGRELYVEATLGQPPIYGIVALTMVDVGNGAVTGDGIFTAFTIEAPNGCSQPLSAIGFHTYLE